MVILESRLGPDGEPDVAACEAIDRSDFFLHGSGPSMLGWAHAEAFVRRTGRGFGVFGVTYGLYGIPEKETLWRDIGRGEWLFDLDQPDEATRIASAVLALAKEPATARAKAAQASSLVRLRFETTMAMLAGELGKSFHPVRI